VPIGFHAVIVLQVVDSLALIKNFGPNWYQNNVEQPFQTMVRQAVRKHGMNETAIQPTALDEIDTEIRTVLTAFIQEKAIPVKLVTPTTRIARRCICRPSNSSSSRRSRCKRRYAAPRAAATARSSRMGRRRFTTWRSSAPIYRRLIRVRNGS
jgi:hypothetical protein